MKLGVLALALLVGCSFGIPKNRRSTQPGVQTTGDAPSCSESRVRPGFDGTMAASMALGALFAGLDLNSRGCGDTDTYGYERNASCGSYAFMIGGGAVLAALFTAGAIYGSQHADRCERDQDAYDRSPPIAIVRGSSKDWPPQLVAACEAERAALLANAQSEEERRQLTEVMLCGPVVVETPLRKRYRGAVSNGIGAGFLVGSITVGLTAIIFADETNRW